MCERCKAVGGVRCKAVGGVGCKAVEGASVGFSIPTQLFLSTLLLFKDSK